jgi:hypothetical protein
MGAVPITELLGRTLTAVRFDKTSPVNERIVFTGDGGESWVMYHDQECCENVKVEDIVGSLDDLVGSPIVRVEANTNAKKDGSESLTWTFYRIGTAKGTVVIRWCGSSNGYYSESVDFERWSRKDV